MQRAWIAALACSGLAAAPVTAAAQYSAPPLTHETLGEHYHFEVSGTLWDPSLFGFVSSEQFGIVGSNINFTSDLGFERTRFKDLRVVLRPSRKQRFRIQYTPIDYLADSTLARTVVFNGIAYTPQVPIESNFSWKVWRFGYEYDFVYRKRGFIGMLFEGRYTEMDAKLASPIDTEYTTVKAPLPALGLVGRAYVAPGVALNFEVTGMCGDQSAGGKIGVSCKQDPDAKYQAAYFDWDIYGTVNFNRYIGAQVGWRRMTTLIDIKQAEDLGNIKFQGLWFGAVVRY